MGRSSTYLLYCRAGSSHPLHLLLAAAPTSTLRILLPTSVDAVLPDLASVAGWAGPGAGDPLCLHQAQAGMVLDQILIARGQYPGPDLGHPSHLRLGEDIAAAQLRIPVDHGLLPSEHGAAGSRHATTTITTRDAAARAARAITVIAVAVGVVVVDIAEGVSGSQPYYHLILTSRILRR